MKEKQKIFENRIAVFSAVIALIAVIVSAIGLIPQFKSAFSSSEKDSVSRSFSGRKVQRIVEDISKEYFDDVKVLVREKENGGKVIYLTIYTFNDERINAEKAIAFAERMYDMAAEADSGIIAMKYGFVSHTSTVNIGDTDRTMLLPVVVWTVVRTSTKEAEEIWISDYSMSVNYKNADIFKYEYDKSGVFGRINDTNYNMEETNYSEDFKKAFMN